MNNLVAELSPGLTEEEKIDLSDFIAGVENQVAPADLKDESIDFSS